MVASIVFCPPQRQSVQAKVRTDGLSYRRTQSSSPDCRRVGIDWCRGGGAMVYHAEVSFPTTVSSRQKGAYNDVFS